MPTLPTLTVTDAQAARLLAAFGSVENYRAWLKETLINRVIEYERMSAERDAKVMRQVEADKLRTEITLA